MIEFLNSFICVRGHKYLLFDLRSKALKTEVSEWTECGVTKNK